MQDTLTLTEALMTLPVYVKVWLGVMAITFAASLLFVVKKTPAGWKPQWEAIAIPVSFFLGAVVIEWLYSIYGLSRILGLGHLVAWTPFYVWILTRRSHLDPTTWVSKYMAVYLVVAGLCLVIDTIDLGRYLIG